MTLPDLEQVIQSNNVHYFYNIMCSPIENFDTRKNELTREGFLKLNLMEANDREGDPRDLWLTLEAMGYNQSLEMVEVHRSMSFTHEQFWGKLLSKVMCYNFALLPKKK